MCLVKGQLPCTLNQWLRLAEGGGTVVMAAEVLGGCLSCKSASAMALSMTARTRAHNSPLLQLIALQMIVLQMNAGA
jgi:hypothetical protein